MSHLKTWNAFSFSFIGETFSAIVKLPFVFVFSSSPFSLITKVLEVEESAFVDDLLLSSFDSAGAESKIERMD